MAFRVELTARAECDIDSALESLTRFSPVSAARWYAGFLKRIVTLEESPAQFAHAAEADQLGIPLREMLYGKRPHVYRILFVMVDDIVRVLHVRHSARDTLKSED